MRGQAGNEISSIAMMPFVNSSNDPNTEYLSDGITESLINDLSQLPNLSVMARSSLRLRDAGGARRARQRFQRPMSLIMADLDLLRDINNTYGHLAGDAVLRGDRGGLPPAAAPLRRAGALRRRGVLDPPAGDAAGAGVRDRRPDPPLGRGAPVRGRDLERADPRHDLDGRRRVPARRPRHERARPPGRPRRLPREAPGPQPRPRRIATSCCSRSPTTARLVSRSLPESSERVVPLAAARGDHPRGRASPDRTPAPAARAAVLRGSASPRPPRRPRRLPGHRRGHRAARSSARRPTWSGS